MNLDLRACEIDVSADSGNMLEISLRGCDERVVFDHFNAQDCLSHFGEDEFLDLLGADTCKRYFDLKDNDE